MSDSSPLAGPPDGPSDGLPGCVPDVVALRRQAVRLAALPQAPWLHQEVARRLAGKLEPIRLEPQGWIDWSAFLGAGADLVQARYPQARRWVVEPHPALVARSHGQMVKAASRSWRAFWRKAGGDPVQDVAAAGAPGVPPWPVAGADMLWANMTLHAHADLPGLMAEWHRSLAVNGFLMCSGLGPDTARELRRLYRDLRWPLPTIDFVDMHDLGDALVQAGFADPVMDMERLTLTWADADALLAELRTWGGNVAMGRYPGLRTPRWLARLKQAMTQALQRPDGRLGLTIEVVYGHAIKPVPRAALSPETRVSLDDMRQMIRQRPAKS